MKTPIQEAIETIKEYRDNGYADVDTCNTILLQLASMLEKEKEVMKLVHKNGYDNSQYRHDCNYGGVEYWDSVPKPFDEFYNETFNTNDVK